MAHQQEDNYADAWKKLNDVVGNEQNIVDANLHAIPRLRKESSMATDIRNMINEANVHLSSLSALGIDVRT